MDSITAIPATSANVHGQPTNSLQAATPAVGNRRGGPVIAPAPNGVHLVAAAPQRQAPSTYGAAAVPRETPGPTNVASRNSADVAPTVTQRVLFATEPEASRGGGHNSRKRPFADISGTENQAPKPLRGLVQAYLEHSAGIEPEEDDFEWVPDREFSIQIVSFFYLMSRT